MSAVRIVVLGAGFGGLELVTRLSAGLGADADIVLIDENDAFHFGFSKLDVLVGAATAESVVNPYANIALSGVQFVQATATSIDASARRVETTVGAFESDILVIAIGAQADSSLTPGLDEGGNEFYTFAGTLAARDVLDAFTGGRVLIAVTAPPFKCPPAPSEAALLVSDFLTARGLREKSSITLAEPFVAPIPPSPEGSAAVLAAFAQRDITWRPGCGLASVDIASSTAVFSNGESEAFDLLLAVPLHRVPTVVAESGLCADGWVVVDQNTLRTRLENVYAIGDVAAANCPMAGAFAMHQAAVVADQIIAEHSGSASSVAFDGSGACLMEFGGGRAARVAITGRGATGGFTSTFSGPGEEFLVDKDTFRAATLDRWFTSTP
ncbi:MAG: FAD/NAD(P)-binding oxidoreductase [Nakamurella sp.]